MKTGIWCIVFASMFLDLSAQMLTEQEAITNALTAFPGMRIADQQLRMQAAMEKSAFNPSQPQLTFEFPNDIGLAFELQQMFDFPGVYSARAKWLKSQTLQQTASANLTRQELIRDVRFAYLEAQASQAMARALFSQDSLWQELDKSTQRLYDGGHINRADQLFSAKQAGLISNMLDQTKLDAANALAALELYTDAPIQEIVPLRRLPFIHVDTTGGFYFDQYLSSARVVAERALIVRKNERLPGIIVGYLRVPELDTDYRSRFSAGLTIPVWQGQYRSEVAAAKIAIEAMQYETDLKHRQAQSMQRQLVQTLSQTNDALNWYERTALPQTEELMSTYLRLYAGGEVDYALTLRNIADALDIYMQYLDTLHRHNKSVITLEFLRGQ